MTEKTDLRADLQKMLDDATSEEQLVEIVSRLALGHTVMGLIETTDEAAEDADEDSVTVGQTFMTHKYTGRTYRICVHQAPPEMIASFERITGYTKH